MPPLLQRALPLAALLAGSQQQQAATPRIPPAEFLFGFAQAEIAQIACKRNGLNDGTVARCKQTTCLDMAPRLLPSESSPHRGSRTSFR